MERVVWTDDRLTDRMAAIDQTFERIDRNLEAIREELRGFRADVSAEFRAVRADLSATQDRLTQIGFGLAGVLITALIALVVALA